MSPTKARWSKEATSLFAGKTVKEVRYLTEKEVQEIGWYSAAPVFVFTDGTEVIASADDEGNDAGALFTNLEKMQVIPVIFQE